MILVTVLLGVVSLYVDECVYVKECVGIVDTCECVGR